MSSPAHELRSRILRGLFANGASQLVNIVVQIFSIPLFIHFWGKQRYGEWIVLGVLPAYLTMTDLGFQTAAGNEILLRYGANDVEGTRQAYATTWSWTLATSGLGLLVFAIVVFAIDPVRLSHLQEIDATSARLVLLALGLSTIFSFQSGVFQIPLRAEKRVAQNASWNAYFRALTFLATVGVVVLHGPLLTLALVTLAMSAAQAAFLYAMAWRYASWARDVWPRFHWGVNKRLLLPALGFNGFPLANNLNIQGAVLVVSTVLGPAAVVGFNVMRTMARFVNQATDGISAVFGPEISLAHGEGNLDLLFRIHRRACRLTFWVGLAICVLLAVFGPTVYRLMTQKVVAFSYPLFLVILASLAINSLHTCSSIIQVATNRHKLLAVASVVIAASGLGLAYVLLKAIGIVGVGLSMVFVETALLIFIVRRTCKMVGDHVGPWLAYVLRPPTRADFAGMRARSR